jgi:hypothetical protein
VDVELPLYLLTDVRLLVLEGDSVVILELVLTSSVLLFVGFVLVADERSTVPEVVVVLVLLDGLNVFPPVTVASSLFFLTPVVVVFEVFVAPPPEVLGA